MASSGRLEGLERLKRRARRAAAKGEDAVAEKYRAVFGGPEGAEVLTDLRAWAGRNAFDINPYVTAFNCGKMGMVEMIDRMMEAH